MQLTPFGKATRKLRIDRGLLLGDMAETLHVSAAFLSSIETGKKSIPIDMVSKISEAYQLSSVETAALQSAFDASVRIVTVRPNTAEQSRFMTALARRFDELGDDEFVKLRATIERLKR